MLVFLYSMSYGFTHLFRWTIHNACTHIHSDSWEQLFHMVCFGLLWFLFFLNMCIMYSPILIYYSNFSSLSARSLWVVISQLFQLHARFSTVTEWSTKHVGTTTFKVCYKVISEVCSQQELYCTSHSWNWEITSVIVEVLLCWLRDHSFKFAEMWHFTQKHSKLIGEISEAQERFTFSLTHKYKYWKKNAKKARFDSLAVTPFCWSLPQRIAELWI